MFVCLFSSRRWVTAPLRHRRTGSSWVLQVHGQDHIPSAGARGWWRWRTRSALTRRHPVSLTAWLSLAVQLIQANGNSPCLRLLFPNAWFLPLVNKQKRLSEKQKEFAPNYSKGFLGHCFGSGETPRTIPAGREQEPFTPRQSSAGWSYFYCYCLSTNLPTPNNDVVQSELFAINDSWVQ